MNQIHLEAMKEELANIQRENSKLKAHCNYTRRVLHDIINLEVDMIDQGSYMASCAINQTEKQSLAENNAQVIRNLIYTLNPPVNFSLMRTEIIEQLRVHADDLESNK